jgi:hypothetical protein
MRCSEEKGGKLQKATEEKTSSVTHFFPGGTFSFPDNEKFS